MEYLNNNTDLHMHSTASDGGYSPTDLLKKCADVGLEYVSLTDHDTVDGIKEAIEVGKELGITVIPGIEFSTVYAGKSVHMLGYGIDYENEQLLQFLDQQKEQRSKRLDVILEKLASVNIALKREDVLEFVDGGSIGRPHVAQALVKHNYVRDVKEAFDRYLAEGKPCYVPKEKEMTPEETIEWIHRTGGIAIIAHPVYYKNHDELIEYLVRDHLLDGIEVYHRDHDEEARAHFEKLTIELEEKYGRTLLKTGGSDFHHEDYGRKREPLGVTRMDNEYALKLINQLNGY